MGIVEDSVLVGAVDMFTSSEGPSSQLNAFPTKAPGCGMFQVVEWEGTQSETRILSSLWQHGEESQKPETSKFRIFLDFRG